MIAALDFSLADPDSGLETMRLAGGLQRFWEVQGYFSEAKRYYHLASEHCGADHRSEAMVRHSLGDVAQKRGETAKALSTTSRRFS